MKSALDRIERSLEKTDINVSKINEHLGNLDVTAAKQQVTLDDHIARTEVAEANLELISSRIDPIEKHVAMWAGAGKVIAVFASIAAISTGTFKLVEFLLAHPW